MGTLWELRLNLMKLLFLKIMFVEFMFTCSVWGSHNNEKENFLDAFSHLYKRLCPSVRPSEGDSRDDIFILIQYIAHLWYRLFVMPNKWKFVDFPLLLTVLLVKIKIFEVRFFQRLCSILTVGFQSFTNDPINFIIDFSLNYKKSSKTLEFKFEPLLLLETSCYLGKMLSCIYFISSRSLKPRKCGRQKNDR